LRKLLLFYIGFSTGQKEWWKEATAIRTNNGPFRCDKAPNLSLLKKNVLTIYKYILSSISSKQPTKPAKVHKSRRNPYF